MDTYKVTIFPSAESDLHNIFIYILDKLVSPNTALEIYNNLLQMILSLETYPTRGSLRKVGQYRNQGFRQLFVNDTLRMYKNDDIKMSNFNCITDTIVEVITTCNTYTLLTVHLL